MRPEFELLLLCARRDRSPGQLRRLRELLAGPFDWDTFYTSATWHGLLPLVYWNLSHLEPGDGAGQAIVPPHVLREFEREFEENAARSFFLTTHLLPALRALRKRGVRAVAYKGPALAVQAYGNLLLRPFRDLDVLVSPGELGLAGQVLEANGYRQQFHSNLPANEYAHSFVRDIDEGNVVIEVHWALTPHNYALPPYPPGAMERLATVNLHHQEVLSMAPGDQVLSLCWHAYKHRWSRLEWIASLERLCSLEDAPLDWENLLALSRRSGSRRMLLCGLSLANTLLDLALPPFVCQLLEQDRTLGALVDALGSSLTNLGREVREENRAIRYFHLGSRERLRDKITYCWRTARSSGQADWNALRPDRLWARRKAQT